jgi:hypothetical protein
MNDFDALAMFAAMDARRVERGLSWQGVADELWEQSSVLNARRRDHPISPATLTNIAKRGDTSCQHALFILRWLGLPPESFLRVPVHSRDVALPSAGPDQRLRWDLGALHEAMDERRREHELTWRALAKEIRCTANQLSGLRTVKYAIGMRLAMRIVQWLEEPAATFIETATW